MPLPGVIFIDAPAPEAPLTTRADIALFAGLAQRRTGPLPAGVEAALIAAGWLNRAEKPQAADKRNLIEDLPAVPAPIESFAEFEALFESKTPPALHSGNGPAPAALAAAVRSFFAEGGQRCYVLRCADPLPPEDMAKDAADALAKTAAALSAIIPWHDGGSATPSASESANWRGLGHLLGLPDVALVSMPDLPALFSAAPHPPAPVRAPEPPEIFRPVSEDIAPKDPELAQPPITAPRLTFDGYERWARALASALEFLNAPAGGFLRRDVMLVAGLPLPDQGDPAFVSSTGKGDDWFAPVLELLTRPGRASPQLQLAFPWIMTSGSIAMPEGVENPEGAVCGLLARNALLRGAFHSAAGLTLQTARDTEPRLERAELETAPDAKAGWLGDRLTLIGRGARGLALISDVTTAGDRAQRAAGVSRLSGILIRAARRAGEELLFETSTEATWARLRRRVEAMLDELWRLGALSGDAPPEAYEVRCDRSTMTQNDIDAGRLIVRINATASQPVERITVTLAFSESGAAQLARAA